MTQQTTAHKQDYGRNTSLHSTRETSYRAGNTTYLVHSKFSNEGKSIVDIVKQLLRCDIANDILPETH